MNRSVRVFNFKALGNCLPTDGFVQGLESGYPDRPFIAGDGGVKVGFFLRSNLSYVYWIMKGVGETALKEKDRKRYLEVPPQSERLTAWLNVTAGDDTRPEKQAEKLAHYLRSEFSYKLGAPNLDRASALEQFIFEQREGHCGRFASALAALLRLRGIPSRVVVGFLPIENNELGGFL